MRQGSGSSPRRRWRGLPEPCRPRRPRPSRRTIRPQFDPSATDCGSARTGPARSSSDCRTRVCWPCQGDQSGGPLALHEDGLAGCDVIAERTGAVRLGGAGQRRPQVLQEEWGAGERRVGQGRTCLTPGVVETFPDHRVESRVPLLDSGDRGIDDLEGGRLTAPDQLGRPDRVELCQVHRATVISPVGAPGTSAQSGSRPAGS